MYIQTNTDGESWQDSSIAHSLATLIGLPKEPEAHTAHIVWAVDCLAGGGLATWAWRPPYWPSKRASINRDLLWQFLATSAEISAALDQHAPHLLDDFDGIIPGVGAIVRVIERARKGNSEGRTLTIGAS